MVLGARVSDKIHDGKKARHIGGDFEALFIHQNTKPEFEILE